MLADALVEASSETPDILIDCATLTGAVAGDASCEPLAGVDVVLLYATSRI